MTPTALLVVDLQNDFCPGAALAVRQGDLLVPLANQLQGQFDLVVATQDWHPPGHLGFASSHPGKKPGEVIDLEGVEQILWPDHCIQHTRGAAFHPDLGLSRITHVIQKGTDPKVDSYSAFFDNAKKHDTGLCEWLRQKNVYDIYVMGIATEYCVKYTCLDALQLGFRVHLIQDACRGVELQSGDCRHAIDEITNAGVLIAGLS